jgi:hypothetical protein
MPGSKVLIIDSRRDSCVLDREQIPVNHKDVTVLFARSIAQAEDLFNQHCEHLAVITVHDAVGQGIRALCALVSRMHMRRDFRGKILAVQGGDKHVRSLREAGCSWKIEGSELEAGILYALSTNR